MPETLLQVKNLATYFYTEAGVVKAVDGVSFEIGKGKTLGIVGESGCGKSVSALSIMRLVPSPPGRIVSGEILYNGKNLLDLKAGAMRDIRGNNISMIFQEPMTSLNPVFTIGNQIEEAIKLHQDLDKKQRREEAIRMLSLVGIPEPARRIKEYPHQLSGGMRQRAMIAMALSCNPDLLIADEPTTALDVTIEAQIVDLLKKLKDEMNMSVMLITHNLGLVSEAAEDVIVMYAGKVVEMGEINKIFLNPMHPYTVGLKKSIPEYKEKVGATKLSTIAGVVPDLLELKKECAFCDRCEFVMDECKEGVPELKEIEEGHWVRCLRN